MKTLLCQLVILELTHRGQVLSYASIVRHLGVSVVGANLKKKYGRRLLRIGTQLADLTGVEWPWFVHGTIFGGGSAVTTEELETRFEEAVGQMYAALYNMRKAGLYQEEYDAMGTVIRMMIQDREVLRLKHGVKP